MHLGMGAQLRRAMFTLPSARAALVAVSLLGPACSSVLAQQDQSGGKLPDAPSATTQQPDANKPASTTETAMALLAGHSKVFPNLAVNTKPLSSEEKLTLAVRNTLSGFTIIGSAASAGISQARNTRTGYGQGAEGYFKRFGASMAFSASSNLLGTYMIASLLKEDPRYFVKNADNFGESLKYSTTRVFITRMDDGHRGINWAGLLGPLGGAALANTYLPADSQGVGNTFAHWGESLAVNAGTNLLREYWPRINKKLRLPNIDIMPGPTATPTPQTPPPSPGGRP